MVGDMAFSIVSTALWIVAILLTHLAYRGQSKRLKEHRAHTDFLTRWNTAVMELYRAESDAGIQKILYIQKLSERIRSLAPNAKLEPMPDFRADRMAEAIKRISTLAEEIK